MKRVRIAALLLAMALLAGCGAGTPAKTPEKESAAPKEQAQAPASFAQTIPTYASAEERLSRMTEAASDGSVSLLFDETTGDIALKTPELIYFSTPTGVAGDARATEAQKNTMASQIRLVYMDGQKNTAELASFPECIAKGQYTVAKMENGVQVNMVIGRAEQRTLVPAVLPAESFERVIGQLEKRPASRMKAFYKLYDPETTAENQLEIIRSKYPVVDDMAIYVLKEITEKERAEIEGHFKTAGYTFEEMEKDLEQVKADETETVKPRFELSICYTLEGGALRVRIPSDRIAYDESHFSLLEIGALEYMAAAKTGEEGYLFLPDGCGAIMRFNKGEKAGSELRLPVYGYDRALTYLAGYDRLMTAALPVFGISSPAGSLLAVIGEGAAMADITASAGGSAGSYAHAGTAFTYRDTDTFDFKDVNTQYAWSLVDPNAFSGTYEIAYYPLAAGAGIPEMAAAYRETVSFAKQKTAAGLPLVLGLYGSVKHQDQILFMPVNRQVPLTTFEDAAVIAEELTGEGVQNLSLRLIGWAKGGLDTGAFSSFSPAGAAGGKKGLQNLSAKMKEQGVALYPDADFAYVRRNTLFDGFYAVGDTARMLDKTYAGYNHTRASSGLMDAKAFRYALKPKAAMALYRQFMPGFRKSGIEGLSLGSLGGHLNSDKSAKDGADRESARKITEQILQDAAEHASVMTEGANAYVFPFAEIITAVPSAASGYPDADESVPFLQMVLHGKTAYTTPAINTSGNFHTEILKAVENGAGLYFELAYRNAELLKNGDFADLYSVDYATWKDQLLASYQEVNRAIGDLAEQTIIGYDRPEKELVRVTYSSGAVIYINYAGEEKTVEGITVPAESFLRTEKGGAPS